MGWSIKMKTVILYATKTGTTEKCAKLLAEKLEEATLVDLRKDTADLNQFDCIIVGGSIRIGTLNKFAKRFIEKNKEILKDKKTAYFICSASTEQLEEMFSRNISKDLLESAICYDTFGGEMDINKQKGIDKFIVKMVSKNKDSKLPEILFDNIENFAKKILSDKSVK